MSAASDISAVTLFKTSPTIGILPAIFEKFLNACINAGVALLTSSIFLANSSEA